MSRPLRVLLLNEFFYPDKQGGTATATSNIARRLKDDHGFEVTVITGHTSYRDSNVRFDKFEDWDGIPIHRVASPNWIRKRTVQRLAGNVLFALAVARKAATIPKPDVVLVSTAPLTLPMAANALLRRKKVPYAYLIYDLDPDRTVALKLMPPDAKPVKALRRHQTKWLTNASKVVAIGRCMKDHLVAAYNLPPAKVDVVEVGADADVVAELPKDTAFRKKHGIDGFVVMYSGNFGQYHDFETLLGAAERLKGEPVTFVLVGGGHKKQSVTDAVRSRRLANVKLFDFVPESELADLLASADLQVVTLEPGMEGLCVPSKFYTCLASGRATLALMSAGPEVSRVVEEAQCGVRVDIGDSAGLEQAIRRALADPAESTEQGKRGRQVFEQLYTTDRTVEKMARTLRDACR